MERNNMYKIKFFPLFLLCIFNVILFLMFTWCTGKVLERVPVKTDTLPRIDGNTTFEGSLPGGEIISPDQSSLSCIIACGAADDFTSRHIFRKSLSVKLTGK
jgi:hypothetical protein